MEFYSGVVDKGLCGDSVTVELCCKQGFVLVRSVTVELCCKQKFVLVRSVTVEL